MLSHFSHVQLCATLWTAAHQAPLSTGFSRQEYWSELPFPSPNMLSRLVITFLPRGTHLFITWLQSPSAVILENQTKNKVWYCFHCLSIYGHEGMGPDAMIFVFWMLSFKPTFSLSSFTFIKSLFSSSSLSAIRVMSSAYLVIDMWCLGKDQNNVKNLKIILLNNYHLIEHRWKI